MAAGWASQRVDQKVSSRAEQTVLRSVAQRAAYSVALEVEQMECTKVARLAAKSAAGWEMPSADWTVFG